MCKVDLHTHSTASPDGGLALEDYRRVLDSHLLDVVAVTDHNTIDFARSLQQTLGERIIVGEEVGTTEGDLIGLYVKNLVPPGLSALKAMEHIHDQGGLVYIPHPFDRFRKGLSLQTLEQCRDSLDIVETYNGRAWLRSAYTKRAVGWAAQHKRATASSSDAHGRNGFGNTYSLVSSLPTRDNLIQLLQDAQFVNHSVGWHGLLYPKLNKLKRRVSHGA